MSGSSEKPPSSSPSRDSSDSTPFISSSRDSSDSIPFISSSSMDEDGTTSRQSSCSMTTTSCENPHDVGRPVTAPPGGPSSSLAAQTAAAVPTNVPDLPALPDRATTAPTPRKMKSLPNVLPSSMPSSSSTCASSPINGGDQNVRVVARVRPLSAKELSERSTESIRAHPAICTIDVKSTNPSEGEKRKFEFDSVFGPLSTQKEVYEKTAGDMVKTSIFKGFNATILAYGQTGSGKTFTMGTDGGGGDGSRNSSGGLGSAAEMELVPPSNSDGVIARAVYDLFETRNSLPQGKDRVKVEMSYLEIYNEQAIDLLSNDPSTTTLQVRDSKTEGVVVPNLKSFPVYSPAEVQRLMEKASQKRAVGSTHMNSVSSRSHAICTLNVSIAPLESLSEEGPEVPATPREGMRAKLTLVDLAGSERIKRTGAEGARMKEGININKGLFVLGQVVSALSELGQQSGGGLSKSKNHSHIPYRDSKLTRLLSDSLGGNSRTVMIACISPAESNIEESINTLRYAERTRNIKNSAVRNVVGAGLSPSEAAALRRENQQLKLELAQMETKLQMSRGDMLQSGNVRGMGNFQALHSAENIETAAKLEAQCSSLLAEIDILKQKAKSHSDEVLEASLRADKWQSKYESTVELAQEQGIVLPETRGDGENESIVSQLRHQLNECKAELVEARTDAAIARATAGAIIAKKGDIASVEEMVNSEECTLGDEDDGTQDENLTSELSAVSAIIEQKEAMVQQMRKERACRDNLQLHFENSLKMLQTEVETLTAERDELIEKTNEEEKAQTMNRRKRKATDDPTTKRLREQISKLEERINELKHKASEHTKSIKMKEQAEKKCAKLMDEIAEDKKHRAALQKKLKEASVEIRAEKKQAQLKAAKMMKDSQKLKLELSKMKNAAEKQAVVLKRKIDEAAAKERARSDLERKRKSAEKMRLALSSAESNEVGGKRRDELEKWIEGEVEYSFIKHQIDDQKQQLMSALAEKRKLMKNNDIINVEELEQIEFTCQSLKETIKDLESTVRKVYPKSENTSTFRFLDIDTFKGLSKPDSKYVLSYLFDMCSEVKQEVASMMGDQESTIQSAVDAALAKEKQAHSKEVNKLKMEHAEATLNLLESTQSAVSSNLAMKIISNDIEPDFKAQVESMIGSYMKSCSTAGQALKSDLHEMKESAEGMQKMIDDVAQGMSLAKKKYKSHKKKVEFDDESDDDFEEDEEVVMDDSSESEYEPTPKTKRGRRKQNNAKKGGGDSPHSLLGENIIDDEAIDAMKVASLKKALRKKGLSITGKKEELKTRLKENILNTTVAVNESTIKDVSFSSTCKKVEFAADFNGDITVDIGDITVDASEDPEFQPKELWRENNSLPNSKSGPGDSAMEAEPKATVERIDSTETSTSQQMDPFGLQTPSILRSHKFKRQIDTAASLEEKENQYVPTTPGGVPPSSSKKHNRPLGFLSSSPRPTRLSPRPLGAHNQNHSISQTIKKRIAPGTTSAKKRQRKGMNTAVSAALEQLEGMF